MLLTLLSSDASGTPDDFTTKLSQPLIIPADQKTYIKLLSCSTNKEASHATYYVQCDRIVTPTNVGTLLRPVVGKSLYVHVGAYFLCGIFLGMYASKRTTGVPILATPGTYDYITIRMTNTKPKDTNELKRVVVQLLIE